MPLDANNHASFSIVILSEERSDELKDLRLSGSANY
jgi:hypothetical protein